MRFGILGPLAVWTSAGEPVAVPGLKVRALLADLLLHEGRPVPADRLIDDLWGEAPPGNPEAALSSKVSQLRRVLEDAEPGARALVESRPAGYLLRTPPAEVDAARFRELVAAGELAGALALWRGPALADFADEPFTQATITRLEEARLAALEDHAEARLARGEHGALAGELGEALLSHPLRERLRAAHMLALYRSGRQSEALESHERLRTLLADELGLDPSPQLAALHQAILRQDPALAAPAGAPLRDRPRGNLPAPRSGLVGRDDAVADVRRCLHDDRLVSLTGPGGVGKTRLALEAAAGLTGAFADGVWLVELAAQERDADLAPAVMAALDVHESGGGPPLDLLAEALAPRELLLVLDNCEHVVEQAADLTGRLLAAAPGLRVLATGREPLGLPGETVWNVPPLDEDGAVRLFAERATASARGFRLDEATEGDARVLCRRLDGIPLALELAATRVRALGVRGLVARLDDRFRLLATGHRGAPPRQQTLMAMIDWSWELLEGPERAVLRRLAAHADGCTLEAAEAVCAGPEAPEEEVVDLLVRLVDRSLVVMADGPRYRLLESVAAYCADRLAEAGEYAAVRDRHRAYYLDLAERAEPHLFGGDQERWLTVLDAESANLRAALDGAPAAEALRLANALTWYWFLRGRWTEARRSLHAASASGDGPPATRARAAAWAAGLAMLQGETDERDAAAHGLFEIDNPGQRARAAWFLLFTGTEYDDADTAAARLAPLMADFAALGDDWGAAASLVVSAKHAHAHGDPAALERDAERAARLFTRLGDRWGRLQAAEWLAGHAELTGDYARAERLQREGLRLAEELRLWPHAAVQLGWLGWVSLLGARYEQAREMFGRARRLGAEQGHRQAIVFGEFGLGLAARRLGDLDEAEDRLLDMLRSIPAAEDDVPPLFLPPVLVELGHIADLRGDATRALTYHRDALKAAVVLRAPRDKAFSLEGLAGAVALAGDHARAARMLGTASRIRDEANMPAGPAESADIDRAAARARKGLGDEVFAAESEYGTAMTAEEHLSAG
ncbi:BTAD domain-containing putative transcriptional regulator [Actinomadura macrotermitis]|uniref:OmpR/PhoB-type domain-containing protein n=1 Tax=Actinomadura macrotermitis TaxID=2585200 RepID=A0A7K0BTZ1_9ACTN|nr:BTAD domain-containing putative transcriptional regulator [Actinomadura macrotermitis]MQY04164.1 hypothetical protein [Actinomadura macrotermitis]